MSHGGGRFTVRRDGVTASAPSSATSARRTRPSYAVSTKNRLARSNGPRTLSTSFTSERAPGASVNAAMRPCLSQKVTTLGGQTSVGVPDGLGAFGFHKGQPALFAPAEGWYALI